MEGEWHETTLGEFVRLQRGHDLTEVDRRPGQVPIMGSAGHNGFHDTAKAAGPGVVIGRSGVGSMGVVTYCASDYWPHNTVLYVTDFLGNDERFTYYFLHHLNLRRFDSGSAQASLNRNYIYPIRIRVPGPTEQRAIAHILGTLDDKIELNRRMNQTLEAMAQALFKSWFVDFDPVRAKAEGCDRGLPKSIVNLFPDFFEDSELGEIPMGWKVGTLGGLCSRIIEKVDEPEDWAMEPLIDLGRMPQKSIALTDWGLGDELTTSVTRFKVQDTLFGAIRPYFHKVGLAPMNGITNVSVFVLRAKHPSDWPYLTTLCSLPGTVEFATRLSRGTKMPVVAWPDLAAYQIALPSRHVREAFSEQVGPLYERIMINVHESHMLAALRDTLMPKLISGELRVKDAERFMESAV